MRLALTVVAVLAGAGAVNAQMPVQVPDDPVCRGCRIEPLPLVTLIAASDSGALVGPPEAVVADERGRYWVMPGPGLPLVYDGSGQTVRVVGTRGNGPGEFSVPYAAALLPGDSVLVLDRSGPRALVVGPDYRPVRTIRLTWPLGPIVILTWPTSVLANGNVGTPEGAGWPLHRVAMDGTDARVDLSFGSGRGLLRPGRFAELAQRLAPARGGNIWASSVVSYRIGLWSPEGHQLRALERHPDWFTAGAGTEAGNPDTPPPSSISAIYEDQAGLLWVFVRVPASTWRAAWQGVPSGAREVSARQIAVEKLFATMVEVIDPSRGRVVARSRMEQWVVSALPGGRVACYGVGADGEPLIRIFELRLRRG
jgi:hypothetical protein